MSTMRFPRDLEPGARTGGPGDDTHDPDGGDDAPRRARAATLAGFAAIVLWSATVALARSATERLGPLTAAAAVYLIAGGASGLALVVRGGVRSRVGRLSTRYLVVCGGLFSFYMLAFYLAVGLASGRAQVIEVGLVNYLWPTLTIVLSLVLLDARATVLLVPGTVAAVAGVALVVTGGNGVSWGSVIANLASNPAAYAFAAAAAVSWALYSTLTRRWAGGRGGGVALFLPATGAALLALRLLSPEASAWTTRAGVEVVVLGGCTSLAYELWDLAMRRGDVAAVAVASYATPLLSTLISCTYLAVRPAAGVWLGCLLIVAGSLVSWRSLVVRAAAG